MNIRDIARITKGKLVCGSPEMNMDPAGISTDSRTIRKGELFIALKGENFDGTRFVEDAFRRGSRGAMVASSSRCIECYRKPVILVKDTTAALQDLAHHNRMRFDIPVICVTGSNGKTTAKEMIWKALSSEYRVLKNEGTKNNHIGVPQTLLKLDASYDMCVLELGANHKGEIKTLSDIARPTAAVITNIGPSHLEHFGSLGNVFRAKIEITSSLERRGLLALCGDDAYLSGFKDRRFKVLRFGLNAANDFRATCVVVEKDRISFTLNGVMDFRLNLLGAHNVYNALAAIAVASHFGVKEEAVRDALASYRHSGMRLNLKKRGGLSIIDDTYNSNPLSMASALDALKAYPARARWVVSGDMLELGKRSGFFHKAMGRLLAKSDIEGLFTMGDLSRHTHLEALKRGMNKDSVKHCTSHEEIVRLLKVRTREGDAVLVKGSRGMRMEEVIKKL